MSYNCGMKKLFILILIVAAIIFFSTHEDKPQAPAENQNTGNDFRPDPSNATFSGLGEDVMILEDKAYGDINNDGKIDTVTFLAERGGGSGVFIYVAAYVSGPVNYKGTNAVFLGDRIAPQDISINNKVITVSYLDRKDDEPYAAEPTVPSSKSFIYQNGKLSEQ